MTYDSNLTTRAESLNDKLDQLLALAEKLRRDGQTDNAIELHALWVDINEAIDDLRERN
jgi:hypothetical protein